MSRVCQGCAGLLCANLALLKEPGCPWVTPEHSGEASQPAHTLWDVVVEGMRGVEVAWCWCCRLPVCGPVSAQCSLPSGSVVSPPVPPQQHCWSGLGPPVLSCGLPLLADSSSRGAVMLAKPVTTTLRAPGPALAPPCPGHELHRQSAGIQWKPTLGLGCHQRYLPWLLLPGGTSLTMEIYFKASNSNFLGP